MNSKSATNQYGSLETFMKHTVCVQQPKIITQTYQNLQTNDTHNSKPDANHPKFDQNQTLLPNQFKLQPDSSLISSPNRVPSPSVPSPADSGISLQSPGSDTSETQKSHARDSETCQELLKTEKHALSTFRVPQLPNKIRSASETCDLCINQCVCQSKERRIQFYPQSCQDDPRLRIRKFVEKKRNNSMMKQIKPSIYSAKARPPVIPKLHRMTLQKLRTMKREKLKRQLKFQQESSRAQDYTYQAEFYQQEKLEIEQNVRISQNRNMKHLNAKNNVPVQSVLTQDITSDHKNKTVQSTSSQNSDNQNSVQNTETHKTHENYNSHPTSDPTIINQFQNNLIQQQANTNNYF